jgi:hypothetical protein
MTVATLVSGQVDDTATPTPLPRIVHVDEAVDRDCQ